MMSLLYYVPIQLLLLLTESLRSYTSHAFTPPTSLPNINTLKSGPSNVRSRKFGYELYMAGVPEIDNWEVLRSGVVTGISRKHPVIDDGDKIETSALADPKSAITGKIVITKSGSKYKLLKESAASVKRNSRKQQNNKAASPPKDKNGVSKSAKEATKQNQDVINKNRNSIRMSAIKDLKLNGKTVGNGKYLLAGSPQRSTSGKSQIWSAYRSDQNGDPTGDRLKVKMTANSEALSRESINYDKITSGIFFGKFVKKMEYLPQANGKGFEKLSALVIDAGYQDLRDLLKNKWGRGLDGKAMRDVAASAGQCIQAVHASRLVWTDLKTENFVVMTQDDGSNGLSQVRGIDLESAVAFGGNPVTYSPEACPPEFAIALGSGDGMDFILDPSYDIWSLGMMLYEVSTGQPYFKGKKPTTVLKNPDFVADLSKIKDDKLRDLIGTCLNVDPKKRPSITSFLLHPYFTTTGIGIFSFL